MAQLYDHSLMLSIATQSAPFSLILIVSIQQQWDRKLMEIRR